MCFGQQQGDELTSDPPERGKGGFSGRFDILSRETADDDGKWIIHDNKRRRLSIVGTFNNKPLKEMNVGKYTKAELKAMSTNDKLVSPFELMRSVGNIDARTTMFENRQ